MRFTFQGSILNIFKKNQQIYLDSCPSNVPINNCDPLNFYDFYETTLWLNFLAVILICLGFLVVSFTIFLVKYREKEAVMKYDK